MVGTTLAENGTFQGEIVVASRIVDYLSSGLYKTPAACIKELLSNAYDADARQVNVYVKPDADRIVIEDDGLGMTFDEFRTHFSHVSESHKREHSDTTPSGRLKIGKIGIGFVAANELCDQIELLSTCAGSTELLHVFINFAEMRKDASERRRDDLAPGAIAKADYQGQIESAASDEHYTWLFLSGIRGDARRILASAARAHGGVKDAVTLYGLLPAHVLKVLKQSPIDNWSQLDAYSETMVKIGLNIPVRYLEGWYPSKWGKTFKPFEDEVAKLNFNVRLDGAEVRKPIVLKTPTRSICERFDFKGEHVSATGYFYSQRTAIKPRNLQGVLLRIRQAAVGEHDPSFWEFPPEENRIIQTWTSAELWADGRLEDAMNIDRRTLRDQHVAYVELQQGLHAFLHDFFKRARKQLYDEPASERRQATVEEEVGRISSAIASADSPLSPEMRREITGGWRRVANAPDASRSSLGKRFSISRMYELVVETATEVLTPAQAARFIAALTRRLRD